MLYRRKTTLEDLPLIAANMREADIAEVKATSGRLPLVVLMNGFMTSETCETIVDAEDTPVGIFGVVRMDEHTGGVWMLATNALESNARSFIRQCREVVDEIHEGYLTLFNYIDARNKLHIRWVKWLGFKFINKHKKYGVEQRPFYEIVRIK